MLKSVIQIYKMSFKFRSDKPGGISIAKSFYLQYLVWVINITKNLCVCCLMFNLIDGVETRVRFAFVARDNSFRAVLVQSFHQREKEDLGRHNGALKCQ